MRRINVDQLRRGSSSNFADHRYCLKLSTSSIASFEPGSIVLRSLSIFVVSSGSRVVDLRLIAEFPALFLGLRHVAEFPALSVDLRRVAGNTRAFWISRAFCRLRRVAGIPALSSRRASSGFPRFRRSARSSLDLPRLRSPASFTLELYYCRVLLCHSIESIWIKLISSLVLKK